MHRISWICAYCSLMFNAFLRVLILISFLNASRKFLFYEVNESKALFFTYSTLLNQLNNSDHYLFNNWISDKSASKKTNSDSTVTSFPHLQTIIINYYKSSGSEFRVNIIQLLKPGKIIWLINRLPARISINFRVSLYLNNLEGGLFIVNLSRHMQITHSNGWFTVLFLESLWYNDVFANDFVSRT